MKLLTKFALAGAALAASTGAYADVALPSSGNGQAVLFVKNTNSGVVYARGIDLTTDQVASQAAIVGDTYEGAGNTPDYSLSFSLASSIGPDAALTGFLNTSDSFTWAVMLGDSTGSILVGDKRAYTTSVGEILTPSNTVLNTALANFNTFVTSVNAALPNTGDNSTASGGLWDQAGATLGQNADVWFSTGVGVNNRVALGATAGFYLLSTNGGTTGTAVRQYFLGQLKLDANGVLSSVPTVPLPPAVWLLSSALAGFAGLRRRRMEGKAAA